MRELSNVQKGERGKLNIFVAKMQAPKKSHNNKAKTDSYTLGAKLITELWVTKQLVSYVTLLQQNTDNKSLHT